MQVRLLPMTCLPTERRSRLPRCYSTNLQLTFAYIIRGSGGGIADLVDIGSDFAQRR